MNTDHFFAGIVRVGIVSSTDEEERTARVIFPDMDDMVSGDLYILQHYHTPVETDQTALTYRVDEQPLTYDVQSASVTYGSESKSHAHNGVTEAHDHPGIEEEHNHEARLEYWIPEVGERVLCLYIPIENGDGFILGGL